MKIHVGNFNKKVPMYFLGDSIKTSKKFCLILYEKHNRRNTIDRGPRGKNGSIRIHLAILILHCRKGNQFLMNHNQL